MAFFVLVGVIWLTYLKHRHERNMKMLEARTGQGVAAQQLQYAHHQVAQLTAEKNDLEERVRNLETIVCSVDFELNAKLNRLASRQLAAPPADVSDPAETVAFSIGSVEPGARLAGRFVVEEALGRGGMGAVFRARDEQLGEIVALKVIGAVAMLDPAAAERFRREASAARRISHPNVVRLHDLGEERGMLFLSMEYIAGTSLAAWLERHGRLPLDQVRDYAVQICQGLEAAHQAGVIHRDLKPANLLVDAQRRVKIIDFGLAALPHLEGMTATGMILGTPEYMAPEQIRGRPTDPRTDVYALGAVLYHALVGHPPFRGETPIAVGFAHCSEPLVPPSEARPDIPAPWSALVERAMAKDPAQRFDSAAQLAAALPA